MSSHLEDYYDFYSDSSEKNDVDDYKVERRKFPDSYLVTALIFFCVVVIFVIVKCLKSCIKRKKQEGEVTCDELRALHDSTVFLVATQTHLSAESVETIESTASYEPPIPSAPERSSLPPAYFEVVGTETYAKHAK